MRFGLFGINFGACADAERLVRVARAAEESGFESIWTGEHVAMPIRDNPVPTPPETPFLDSLVALTTVAAHTQRVRLGTGILVLPHHNPVLVVNGQTGKSPLTIEGKAGSRVRLDAAGSTDPDGNHLTVRWWFYPEAGTGIPTQPVFAGGLVPVGGGANQNEGGIRPAPAGLRDPPALRGPLRGVRRHPLRTEAGAATASADHRRWPRGAGAATRGALR